MVYADRPWRDEFARLTSNLETWNSNLELFLRVLINLTSKSVFIFKKSPSNYPKNNIKQLYQIMVWISIIIRCKKYTSLKTYFVIFNFKKRYLKLKERYLYCATSNVRSGKVFYLLGWCKHRKTCLSLTMHCSTKENVIHWKVIMRRKKKSNYSFKI